MGCNPPDHSSPFRGGRLCSKYHNKTPSPDPQASSCSKTNTYCSSCLEVEAKNTAFSPGAWPQWSLVQGATIVPVVTSLSPSPHKALNNVQITGDHLHPNHLMEIIIPRLAICSITSAVKNQTKNPAEYCCKILLNIVKKIWTVVTWTEVHL